MLQKIASKIRMRKIRRPVVEQYNKEMKEYKFNMKKVRKQYYAEYLEKLAKLENEAIEKIKRQKFQQEKKGLDDW